MPFDPRSPGDLALAQPADLRAVVAEHRQHSAAAKWAREAELRLQRADLENRIAEIDAEIAAMMRG